MPASAELPRDGEIIVFEPDGVGRGWDLAAQDPETGEVRTIVETDGVVDCPDPARCRRIQVMDADGSDLHPVFDGGDACCSPPWSPNGDRILFQPTIDRPREPAVDSEVWTVSAEGSDRIKVFDSDGCDMGEIVDALPVWAPNGTQVAYNDCGTWVVANADGTGEGQPIDELVWRSWVAAGLTPRTCSPDASGGGLKRTGRRISGLGDEGKGSARRMPATDVLDTAFRLMCGIPQLAYGRRMTEVGPALPAREANPLVYCATCGHSDAVHSNSGDGRCLRSACACDGFIVGVGPDPSAQVLP